MGHILALRMRRIPSLLQPITTVDPILLIHAISSSSPLLIPQPSHFLSPPLCLISHPYRISPPNPSVFPPPTPLSAIHCLTIALLEQPGQLRYGLTAVRLPVRTDGL
jgi:hypothetical protein